MKPQDTRVRTWRQLWLPVWIAVIGGLSLSLGAFFLARQQESLRAGTEFIRRADIHYAALQTSLNRHLESLRSMQKLMQLSTNHDPATFNEWARDIVSLNPEIQVVVWCPRVRQAERAAYEAAARQRGLTNYVFTELDTNLQLRAAGPRAEYFPVFYCEPIAGNEVILGMDVAGGQVGEELRRARDTAQPTASGRVEMVQKNDDRLGVIVTLPVYRRGVPLDTVEQRREAFTGAVQGVFRMHDLLTAAWRGVPMVGVDTLILDGSALNPTNRFILFHASAGPGPAVTAATEEEFRAGPHYDSTMRVGLRTWNFLFRPVPQWWSTQLSWLPWFILVGGLGATWLTGAYGRASARRKEVIENTVTERTAQWQQVNGALVGEVAERRKTEAQLRRTEGILVLAQRIGRVGSWDLDLVNHRLSWSAETFRIFGRDPDVFEPTPEAFIQAVHPEDRAPVEAASRASLQQGARYDIEHRLRRPNGSECVVHEMAEISRDEQGNPARLVGTVQDVTEWHRAEERLAWERNLLRTLIDALPDYIFLKDRDGHFILTNLAHQNFLGAKNTDEVLGRSAADFLSPESGMITGASDQRVLESGLPVVNQEEPLLTRDGQRRHLLTTKIPLFDAQGRLTGIVGVCRDITDRKRAEDEQQLNERKFRETQKLESLGVLAGGIAQDFNNLLTGILGNATLARMELPPESPLHSYLQQIELSSQRAADLCKQMLAYSGKGRFVIQSISLSGLVNETLHLLRLSISKKAVLKLHLTESLPLVMADATQIRQIIMNLVMNASDAIGEKSGVITISTSVLQADRKYLVELIGAPDLAPGAYVVLEVTDNGAGMTQETKARMFEPFFTTKFTGRGLGLAAVLGIVRGHKGALKVYSELGRGSTFRLLLPSAGTAPGETKMEHRPAPLWRGTGLVLVIDDEETVRIVAAKMLKMLGFEVMTADDGEKGVHAYRAQSENISAVLLDLTMPRMDGEETFREIRRIRPDACVILMSGFNEQEAAARFVGKGLAGFVQKPFSPDELRQRLAAFGAPENKP